MSRTNPPTEPPNQIGEGDLVVTRTTLRGTRDREFMGISPTGNRVALDTTGSVVRSDARPVRLSTAD